jgi:hypothetical protein
VQSTAGVRGTRTNSSTNGRTTRTSREQQAAACASQHNRLCERSDSKLLAKRYFSCAQMLMTLWTARCVIRSRRPSRTPTITVSQHSQPEMRSRSPDGFNSMHPRASTIHASESRRIIPVPLCLHSVSQGKHHRRGAPRLGLETSSRSRDLKVIALACVKSERCPKSRQAMPEDEYGYRKQSCPVNYKRERSSQPSVEWAACCSHLFLRSL